MKKILFLLIIPFLLSGCYDYNELNDLAIISGVGIDYKDDKFSVTFEIISTKKSGGDSSASSSSYNVTAEAKTITEAFLKNGNNMDKVPYFDHIEIVVISEEIAKNYLNEVSEYLIRSTKFRDEFYMAISKDTTAKELISTTTKEKPLASNFLVQLLENSHDSDSAGYYTPFTETLNSIITDGEDAIMQVFTLKDKKIVLDGMGIFKDFELKTIINTEKSPIVNLLNNFNIQNILFSHSCDKNNKVVISIYDGNIKFEPNINNITVKAKLNARIHEDNCSESLRNVDTYKELESEFTKIIESIMKDIINILKTYESNALKIGLYEHIKYRNDKYFEWKDKEFKYDIDLKINKKGLIFEVE